MSTWPKTRPLAASDTHATNASREAAATLPDVSGGALCKLLLRVERAGALYDQVRHRGVRADRRAVEDRFVLARCDLAAQAQVLWDGLARMPALGDKDGDQDHVSRGYAPDDRPDLGFLVEEAHLDHVV